jgi:muramidase (phage lysozyme)
MRRAALTSLVLLAGGLAAWALSRPAEAAAEGESPPAGPSLLERIAASIRDELAAVEGAVSWPTPGDAGGPPGGDQVPGDTGTPPSFEAALAALLATIRAFESGGDYSVTYGGQRFDGFADHPRRRVYFRNPATGKTDWSDAAGAYQFISTTWDWLRSLRHLPDFSPASQDAAAAELLQRIGAWDRLKAGDIEGAIRRAGSQWASLPGSTARQGARSMDVALAEFNNNLA